MRAIRVCSALALFVACLAVVATSVQAGPPPSQFQSLAPPVLRDDAALRARSAKLWSQGDSHWALLEQGVTVRVGVFGFRADRALVRVDLENPGQSAVTHLMIVLENAEPLMQSDAITANGELLLVTVSTRGETQLRTDLSETVDQAPGSEFMEQGQERIDDYLRTLAQPLAGLPNKPVISPEVVARSERRRAFIREQRQVRDLVVQPSETVASTPGDPPSNVPTTAGEASTATADSAGSAGRLVDAPVGPSPVLPTRGQIFYNSVSRFAVQLGDEEHAAMLFGPVRMAYLDDVENREVTLEAQRVVVFFRADDETDAVISPDQIPTRNITGIYMEDDAVVSDGEYTVRAPRIFYDLAGNRALLLDAVLYTWNVESRVPLYLRAKVIRQTSADGYDAENARLTTSEFGRPHFAIGASRFTVRKVEQDNGNTVNRFTAKNTTFRLGPVPVLYWPYLAGDADKLPLRGIRTSYDQDNGPDVQTRWDVFSLAGIATPPGFDLDGQLDYRGDHGLGLGGELNYSDGNRFGTIDGYYLPNDNGEDRTGGDIPIIQDGEERGFFDAKFRQTLPRDIELTLRAAYVDDPTFLPEFFEQKGAVALPMETSVYAKKQGDHWAATALGRFDLIDFTPQSAVLQAPGYTVDKLPEFGLYTFGQPLLDNRLSWFSETRFSRMRLSIGNDSPFSRGLTDEQSLIEFGIPDNNTSFQAAAEAAGLPLGTRTRFDSRHELTAPLEAGPVNITPFLAGRFTGYDDNFEEFAGEDQPYRFWGSAGVRLHTTLQRTWGGVSSRVLDVDGLRHIVEPQASFAIAGSSIESDDLPLFDDQVESLSEGAYIMLALDQTLQTRRGGPGRQRTVDMVTMRNELVLRSDDADTQTVIPRYYDYRPEFSQGGDRVYTQLLWMLSDSFGTSAEFNYSLETEDLVQWRVSGQLRQGNRAEIRLTYTEIEPLDEQLLTYGVRYRLTSKYNLDLQQTQDLSDNAEARSASLSLERQFSRWRARFFVGFDQINDEQTFGIIVVPDGVRSSLGLANLISTNDQN